MPKKYWLFCDSYGCEDHYFSDHPPDYLLILDRMMLKAFFYLTCDEGENYHKIK